MKMCTTKRRFVQLSGENYYIRFWNLKEVCVYTE